MRFREIRTESIRSPIIRRGQRGDYFKSLPSLLDLLGVPTPTAPSSGRPEGPPKGGRA